MNTTTAAPPLTPAPGNTCRPHVTLLIHDKSQLFSTDFMATSPSGRCYFVRLDRWRFGPLSPPRLVAIARGVNIGFAMALLLCMTTAVLAASVTVQLRSSADRAFTGSTIDSAVIVGLVLPVSVLARTMQDRVAWISATSPRSLVALRAGWIFGTYLVGFAVAGTISKLTPPQQHPPLVFAATLILLALAVISATIFGAGLSWVIPGATALAASTPGVIPIRFNWLILADRTEQLAIAAYVAFDEYGLRRQKRLIERTPGVTDE